jgi:hypothetical protein
MLSCDTCISGSFAYVRASQPLICSGDQRRRSLPSTMSRNRGRSASLHGFGRLARSHAPRSARNARYRRRPPSPFTSRLIVDAARPN